MTDDKQPITILVLPLPLMSKLRFGMVSFRPLKGCFYRKLSDIKMTCRPEAPFFSGPEYGCLASINILSLNRSLRLYRYASKPAVQSV